MIFLILSFAISSGKLIFLIMWILSLFGIAFYLIYVEYTDYKMMERMKDYGVDVMEHASLVVNSENIEAAEEIVNERLDKVDERRAKIREKVRDEIDEKIEEIKGGEDE
jgi:PP-loop superfamily ATP-utilizing enzyme